MDIKLALSRRLSMGEFGESASSCNASDIESIISVSSLPGTPLSKRFSEIDLLESGVARETIMDQHVTPACPKLRKLTKCHVIREDHSRYCMYNDSTDSFMLCAKLVGSTFYISQYESFCDTFVSESRMQENPGPLGSGNTFCAVLRLNPKTKTYKLINRFCEGCDDVLGLHTCGAEFNPNGDRQILAEIKHGSKAVPAGQEDVIDCNVVGVKLPTVYTDLSRHIWCNRSNRRPLGSTMRPLLVRSKSHLKDETGSMMSTEGRVENDPGLKRANSMPVTKADNDNDHAATGRALAGNSDGLCVLSTRPPRYDRNTGSLRMKFLNNRVQMASSKNLIFCIDRASDHLGSTDKNACEERVAMQFGKYNDERFNLDYRFPLAPVQAFGLALSLFQWQAGSQD